MAMPMPPDDDAWFGRLSMQARAYFRDKARIRHWPRRAAVYSIGDPPEGLYQLLEGELHLISYPVPGKQLVNLVVMPGDWFGELSVIDGKPRPHDAICAGEVRLLHIPMAAIEDYARVDPSILGSIALIACSHQRTALRLIGSILSKPGRARVASLLLATTGGGQGMAPVKMGQAELAAQIGMSRQHLSIILRDMRREGLISTGRSSIRVLDRGGMESLACWEGG